MHLRVCVSANKVILTITKLLAAAPFYQLLFITPHVRLHTVTLVSVRLVLAEGGGQRFSMCIAPTQRWLISDRLLGMAALCARPCVTVLTQH